MLPADRTDQLNTADKSSDYLTNPKACDKSAAVCPPQSPTPWSEFTSSVALLKWSKKSPKFRPRLHPSFESARLWSRPHLRKSSDDAFVYHQAAVPTKLLPLLSNALSLPTS